MKNILVGLALLSFFIAGCSIEEKEYEIVEMYRIEEVEENGIFTTRKRTNEYVEFIYKDEGKLKKNKVLRGRIKIAEESKVTHSFVHGLRLHLTPDDYNDFLTVPLVPFIPSEEMEE